MARVSARKPKTAMSLDAQRRKKWRKQKERRQGVALSEVQVGDNGFTAFVFILALRKGKKQQRSVPPLPVLGFGLMKGAERTGTPQRGMAACEVLYPSRHH